ncbi:hypothetical protein [Cellvibrio sp. QJXJ]|uniref:hypothetical protein n=1 Tax=Cellvibrio sp. QJXJ TaxID=2964606 RepID=UPI0021C39873|nr:hypothetical protein [Cellvibrio sp. QJXJ]UUA75156.1 hypothetical protein NNX04_22120 [Cellvibrio sp. QJXJ]
MARMNLSEYKLEQLMGGMNRYNAIWWALCNLGLRFVCNTSSGKTTVFGMNEKRVWSIEIQSIAFFYRANDQSVSPDEFANQVLILMTRKHKSMAVKVSGLPTADLVEKSLPHRVLWARTVIMMDSFTDRLYDACFEMGDGGCVISLLKEIESSGTIASLKQLTKSNVMLHIKALPEQPIVRDTRTIDMFSLVPA